MNPWLFLWAPRYYFPLSGGVAQNIEPDLDWFFNGIPLSAGDSEMEKKAFEVASYGRQLGLITEVLIDLAESTLPKSKQAQESLARLKEIQGQIEQHKVEDGVDTLQAIQDQVERLKAKHPASFAQLRESLQKMA